MTSSNFDVVAPVTVTLDLNQLTGAIVGVDSYDRETNSGEPAYSDLRNQVVDRVAALVVKDVGKDIRAEVMSAVNLDIDIQVRAIITEVVTTGIQTTNGWGEPSGKVTTLREEIIKSANALLKGGGTSYDRKPGLLEKLIADEVTRAFRSELKEAIDAAKVEALGVIKDMAAQAIAEKLAAKA